MKGLILKDLYIIKGFSKQYGMVLAFMVIWSIVVKSMSFVSIYAILMGSMLVSSTISVDESVSFTRFALTMPISTGALLKSKYALFLITTAVGAVIGLLFHSFFYLAASNAADTFEWEGLAATVSVFVIANAITLPITFKAGAEKARYVYVVVMLIITVVIFTGAKLCNLTGVSFEAIEKVPTSIFCLCCAVFCAAVIIFSYFVSVKLVKNKEW